MEKFSTSKDGYNKDEVNKFVNEVVNEYESMLNKLKQKDSEITEDELKVAETEIQKITDKNIEEIDKILADKETEIMSV